MGDFRMTPATLNTMIPLHRFRKLRGGCLCLRRPAMLPPSLYRHVRRVCTYHRPSAPEMVTLALSKSSALRSPGFIESTFFSFFFFDNRKCFFPGKIRFTINFGLLTGSTLLYRVRDNGVLSHECRCAEHGSQYQVCFFMRVFMSFFLSHGTRNKQELWIQSLV